jgi:hypothetical protein
MQEWHALLKDCRQARNDLRAEREALHREITAAKSMFEGTAVEIAANVSDQYTAIFQATLNEYVGKVVDVVEEANVTMRARATELAAIRTPEDFMKEIIAGLSATLAAAFDKKLDLVAQDVISGARTAKKRHHQQEDEEVEEAGKLPPARFTRITLSPMAVKP